MIVWDRGDRRRAAALAGTRFRAFRPICFALAIAIVLLSLPVTQAADDAPAYTTNHPPFLKPDDAAASPYTTLRVHNAGNMHMSITNWGVLGNPNWSMNDPETGQPAPGIHFPAGFSFEHLNLGAIWVGAIVKTVLGNDTLVSTAHDNYAGLTEFYPESYFAGGNFTERSNDNGLPQYHPDAVSAEDFICSYTDTLTNQYFVPIDPATLQRHRPMRVKVRQESYVWPYDYAEDFVIIRYWLINMRDEPLYDVWFGILVNPRIQHDLNPFGTAGDEMCGFLQTAPSITGYGFEDSIRTAWFVDNDGDAFRNRSWNEYSVRSALGFRFLGTGQRICLYGSEDSPEYSYNWWSSTWGPQREPGDKSIYGAPGHPHGDKQKYRYLSNREIDYDQHLANLDFTQDGWIGPPGIKAFSETDIYNLADGHNINALLSIGPFRLEGRDSIPIGMAVVAGDFVHNNPRNGRNLDRNPEAWFENLDLGDLSRNAQWAAWVYDNPGVDTDGDGCSGRTMVTNCRDTLRYFDEWCVMWHDSLYCWYDFWAWDVVCDSIHYIGDGIPDLTGPPPPPSPQITITSEPGKIHIRWDGHESELYFDNFAQQPDFEGYNVYGGLGYNQNTLNLMASWDMINYDRYHFMAEARPSPWLLDEPPFTLEQLQSRYGADIDPTLYTGPNEYFTNPRGERMFFKPHGGNRGNEYIEAGQIVANNIQYIRTDSLLDQASGSWKYYGNYECTFDNLLPSTAYYFAVTSFDFGLPGGNLGALESAPQSNMELAYAADALEFLETGKMNVVVYPNPYKIDGGYRQKGFEDPNREGFIERTRRIHFVNLPPRAVIKIWSLDGDLIREITHPESRYSDSPSHTAWDMITRNTQAVTSGIYLYSVESEWGNQVGKIVIIK